MTTAIGQFRHVVSLVTPGAGTPDPDGGWGGDAWDPLDPPTWHCSIQAASLRDLQRLSGGVLSTTATHLLRGRYHPQLTRTARIYFGDRVFDVESVHDQDERRIEVDVIAHEQLGAAGVPALPYADQVIADGARAYWRLGDLGGTLAIDSVGFAHGTISGGVTLKQPGALMDSNPSMLFDGATGKIVTTIGVTLGPIFTLELWIKTTQATGAHPAISTPFTGGHYFYAFRVENSKLLVVIFDPAVAGIGGAASSRAVADGAWHHVVWVFPGGSTYGQWIDGVLDSTCTLGHPIAADTQPLEIGFTSNGAVSWPGFLDDIALYPLALTGAQIAAHYAARNGT